MDVLVVGGAWALGSVAVSLLVGAVVARAERPLEDLAAPLTAGSSVMSATAAATPPPPRVLTALPLALPAPRTSSERTVTTS